MLHQLHWQYENGTTKMIAQREINSFDEMRIFVKEAQRDHPLLNTLWPRWMACNEKSKHFIFMKKKAE